MQLTPNVKNVLEMTGIAYFFIFFTVLAHADIETDRMFVTGRIKQAVQNCDSRLDEVKTTWQDKQIKKTFMLLLGVQANKLSLFMDEELLAYTQKILLGDKTRTGELTLPLEKQRLEMIFNILRAARNHDLVPRIFDAYHEATRVLTRNEASEGNLPYAVGKGLERFAIENVMEIDSAFQDLFDSTATLQDPIQVFRLAELASVKIIPLKDIKAWHEVMLQIEPNLFLKGEDLEFYYARLSRRVFTHPNYLYHYLIHKDPNDLPQEALEFIRLFEESVPVAERLKMLPPLEWAHIFDILRETHPTIVEGIFSFTENKVYLDFYGAVTNLDQSHIKMSSEMIAHAYKEKPEELMAAFRFILRKQGGFSNFDLNSLTAPQFMELFQRGEIPLLTDSLGKVKLTREVLKSLEEQVLRSPDPLNMQALEWAEKTVDRNLAVLDGLWSDLRLTTLRIDVKYVADRLTNDNAEHISYVRGLLSKLFGEDYILGLKALKIHIRELKRQTTKKL